MIIPAPGLQPFPKNKVYKEELVFTYDMIMKTSLRFAIKILVLFLLFCGAYSAVYSQWSAPVNISPGAVSALLNESMGSCLGVSNDTVHVVWADRLSINKGAIFYTRSADTGLTWSTPVAITSLNGNAWNPAIAINGKNVHVVWREIDTVTGHRTSMYEHSTDGGTTWGTRVVIDTVVADWPAITVSGNTVYIANDIVTSASPYNTEIFFLRSTDNGTTWSAHQQLTYSLGRSEDEAITAQGTDVFMTWNDNRNGPMQIFYKHSADLGQTWDADVLINSEPSYGTMVSADNANIDAPSAGAPSGHYQIHLNQSADTGSTWGADMNLTNDPANTYYYPYMVRDGSDLHVTYVKSGAGGQYLHSGDGGTTWDTPYSMGFSGITPFIAYTGCVLHVILPDSGHINYFRNPTGNAGPHCITTTGISPIIQGDMKVTIYPNPFIYQTTLEISTTENQENAVVKIFNAFGQQIISSAFGINNKLIIDRDNLKSGIYFYKVFQEDKEISTGKMLVE